jgi:hypothetical protein
MTVQVEIQERYGEDDGRGAMPFDSTGVSHRSGAVWRNFVAGAVARLGATLLAVGWDEYLDGNEHATPL